MSGDNVVPIDTREQTKLDDLSEHPERYIAFEDESILIDWVDSPRGARVTFLLPPADDVGAAHPFKRFYADPVASKGARFFLRCIELADDESPIDQEARARVQKIMADREGKGAAKAREAGMMCSNPRFWAFVRDELFKRDRDPKVVGALPHRNIVALKRHGRAAFEDESLAREVSTGYIYAVCAIKSRRELDHHPRKAAKFDSAVVEAWHLWMEGRKDDEKA